MTILSSIKQLTWQTRLFQRRVIGLALLILAFLMVTGFTGQRPHTAAFANPSVRGLPFGPAKLPSSLYRFPYTSTGLQPEPEEVIAELDQARAAGLRVLINLAGDEDTFKDADGRFSLELWLQRVDRFQGIDLDSYVADGTLAGHFLFDEPFNANRWNGQVSYADIEATAAHSHELWPSMPAGVTSNFGFLAGGAPWNSLDFAIVQYATWRGDFNEWLANQIELREQLNLGLVWSLNIVEGNDNETRMTAQQIRTWGAALAAVPEACLLTLTQYNADMFSQADIINAMRRVGKVARDRNPAPCSY